MDGKQLTGLMVRGTTFWQASDLKAECCFWTSLQPGHLEKSLLLLLLLDVDSRAMLSVASSVLAKSAR